MPEAQMNPYQQPIDDVLAALQTGRHGLSSAKARERLERYGPNELIAEKAVPGWRKFLAQFQNILVVLLLAATAISLSLWLQARETALPYEAIAIFGVVLLKAGLGYIQESRAESAAAALRQMAAGKADVIRDGERKSIPATELVPGDIIEIKEGDTIPADARILQSVALQTAEAPLTGESLPVSKDTSPIPEDVPLGDRHNMVFSGTAVTYGHGRGVVVATGMETEMGRIAGMLKQAAPETTPLQKELHRTGRLRAQSRPCGRGTRRKTQTRRRQSRRHSSDNDHRGSSPDGRGHRGRTGHCRRRRGSDRRRYR
jgi:Ca2+-transporting ATPase